MSSEVNVPEEAVELPEDVERYAFYRDVETGDGEWRELLDANAAAVPGREVVEFIDLRSLPAIIEQARSQERQRVREEALSENAKKAAAKAWVNVPQGGIPYGQLGNYPLEDHVGPVIEAALNTLDPEQPVLSEEAG